MPKTTVSHPMTLDCVARWPFDEPATNDGVDCVDATGNAHDGMSGRRDEETGLAGKINYAREGSGSGGGFYVPQENYEYRPAGPDWYIMQVRSAFSQLRIRGDMTLCGWIKVLSGQTAAVTLWLANRYLSNVWQIDLVGDAVVDPNLRFRLWFTDASTIDISTATFTRDVFHHFSVTWNQSAQTATWYVDGVEETSQTVTGKTIQDYQNGWDVQIRGLHHFDDFAIYNQTKSARWINLAYQIAHEPRTATGDLLRIDAGTKKRYFAKISGVPEIFWDNNEEPGTDKLFKGYDIPGMLPLSKDCAANWRMNARAATMDEPDYTGNGHTAVGTSDPPVQPWGIMWADGTRSRGPFDGAGDLFTVANASRLQPQAFTLVLWTRRRGAQPADGPMIFQDHGVRPFSWTLRRDASANIRYEFSIYFDDGGSLAIKTYDRHFPAGWYMFTCTWDGATASLYVGNVLQGTATPSGSSAVIDYDSSDIKIGRDTNNYGGWLGPMAIYYGAKSVEWVHRVYFNSRGYSRPGLNCLRLPENEFSSSLDMKTMKVDCSSMQFEFDNVRDPTDKTLPHKYYFSKLFAPGRIAATDVVSTTVRRRELGEEQLDADATNVYAQSITADWPAAGEANIGQERFGYGSTTTITQTGFPTNQTIGHFEDCERGLYPALTSENWAKVYPYPRTTDVDAGDIGNDQVVASEVYSMVGREIGLYCVAWNKALGAWFPENQAELVWAGQITEGAGFDPGRGTWSITGESILRRLDREVGRHFPTGFVEGINLTGEDGRKWRANFYDSNGVAYAFGQFEIPADYYTQWGLARAIITEMEDPTNWIRAGGGTFATPTFRLSINGADGAIALHALGTFVHTDGEFAVWMWEFNPDRPCHAWQALGFEIGTTAKIYAFSSNATIPEVEIVGERPGFFHYQPTHPDYNGRHLRAYWKGNDKLWDEQGDITPIPLFKAEVNDSAIVVYRCDETSTGANLTDATGHGYTGVAQGGGELAVPAGKFDGARYYTAGAGGWFAAYAAGLQPAKFTIQAWIYITATSTQGKLFQHRATGGIASAVDLRVTSAGIFEFYVKHTDSTHAVATSTTTSTDIAGKWTHIQASWDGKTARLWINAVLEDEDNSSPGDVDYEAYPLAIARDHATTSWGFPGYIDDVALYNTPFAPGAAWFIFHDAYRDGFGGEKSAYIGAYSGKFAAQDVEKGYEYHIAVGPTGATGGDSYDAMYHSQMGFAASAEADVPLRFQNCYVIQPGTGTIGVNHGPLEVLLFSLLSTGSRGYNGTYDKLPEPLAVGFPEELVDINSFLEWDAWASAAGGTLAARRFYLIEKPGTKWIDLWQREAQLFGLAAVWERGQLRCKSIIHPSTHLVDVTIDAAAREGRDAYPGMVVSTDSVGNRWSILTAHNLDGEKAKFKATFNDVESQLGLDMIAKIDIEHPGIQNHGKFQMEQSIDALFELILLDRAWLYRYAQQRVTAPLAPTQFNRIAVGDTVAYQALKHPDPYGSGEMSVDAKALVLNQQWSIARDAGAADLLIFSTPADDFRPWAGAALVDIDATNGGWDAVNYRLTLVPRHFGAATDSKDGFAFNDTDEIMIIESAPEDVTSVQSWGPYAVDGAFEADGANLLTIETATLAGWDPTVEYFIVPAIAASATATQLEENLYQAAATTHVIPGSIPAHKWG